jgi:hypothetical protein
MKKRVGSGSISQRSGSGDPDPALHQNVMDPQHWKKLEMTSKAKSSDSKYFFKLKFISIFGIRNQDWILIQNSLDPYPD